MLMQKLVCAEKNIHVHMRNILKHLQATSSIFKHLQAFETDKQEKFKLLEEIYRNIENWSINEEIVKNDVLVIDIGGL